MKEWYINNFQKGENEDESTFEQLLRVFQELILHTSGDVEEALSWLTELDKAYELTTEDYGIADFIDDLEEKGYIQNSNNKLNIPSLPTAKLEKTLRKTALNTIFSDLKKFKQGQHNTKHTGLGQDFTSDMRPYSFGDKPEQIAMSESLKNAQVSHGIDDFKLTDQDLVVNNALKQTQTATVLMIDISHSMILYGEDRITPAKRVALALAELIKTQYPKDKLDIITFGNTAQTIQLKDIPYLQVGPYHTNTVAGLELAQQLLSKSKCPNKQIMMITDGKPSCIKVGKKLYKNAYGLDKRIINRTLAAAAKCRKLNIPIITFAIARDPYLQQFIETFTKVNRGKAFYSSLDELGSFILKDYTKGKKRA